jgi:hypothetical protein
MCVISCNPDQPCSPPSLLYNAQHVSFFEVKGPGRGIDHPGPSSTEIQKSTGSGKNTWRFCKTVVSGTVGMGNLSLSALLARLKAFQLSWSAGLLSIGLLLWRRISKTTILSWLRGYFVGTSIFIRTSVPSRNTSSSEDISRARCMKRNQGQWWIWNRTPGKKWRQFLPTCCNEWCRTSRNACRNVLTRSTTLQTLYSRSECCN